MNQEQREEIEKALLEMEDMLIFPSTKGKSFELVCQFARQQLSLRVDGEKLLRLLREMDKEEGMEVGMERAIEALVLECLTTEEKL